MNALISAPLGARAVGVALCLLVVFLSGFWLNRHGQPYGVALLTTHKLVALAAAGVLGATLFQASRVAAFNTVELVAGAAAGLFFLAAVATGGLLSADTAAPDIVHAVHRVAPWLTLLASAATLYLLAARP